MMTGDVTKNADDKKLGQKKLGGGEVQRIGTRGAGRPKGVPNKNTTLLKEAILRAAEAAGGGGSEGLVAYLTQQAHDNPAPFMSLLGKVLPLQLSGGTGITVVLSSDASKL